MTRWHPHPIRCLALAPILLAPVLLVPSAAAQSQARLIELRDGKLLLPFLEQADWARRFDDAKTRATRSGKLIFAYFTRSYAP